jgi:phage baseplate assembly protein W
MNLRFPYQIDSLGRTADAGGDRHVRDLIEQVLFTAPGERVNRPTFGSGVMQLVFAPGGEEAAAASQFLIQSGLQQWLGDLISVEAVDVVVEDATMRITVRYVLRRNDERRTHTFERTT